MSTNPFTRPVRTGVSLLLVGVTLLALSVALTAAAPAGPAHGAAPTDGSGGGTSTLVVDDGTDCQNAGFTRVSDALAAASPGDTIRVCAGTYVESVTVDKPVSLIGNGDATLSGNGSLASGLTIDASNVLIRGLTVRNYTDVGIGTNQSARRISSVRIENNVVRDIDPAGNVNAHNGILLEGDTSTVRSDWTIAANTLVDTDSNGIAVVSTGFVEGVDIHDNEIRVANQSAGLEAVLVAAFGNEPIRDIEVRDNRIDTDTTAVRFANNRGSAIQQSLIEGNRIRSQFEGIYLNPYCGGGGNCTATQSGNRISDNDITAPDGIVVEVEDTASLTDLGILDGNTIDATGDAVRLTANTPASEVEIHNNTFDGEATYGVNNRNTSGVVNATANAWGHPTGPGSAVDPDAPFSDPVTGTPADGQGAQVSEGSSPGVSNVRFDPSRSTNTVSSCRDIGSPGRYQLTGDIVNSSVEACLNVTASNVVINGNGYAIDGQLAYPTFGVLVYDPTTGIENVTVRNLTVRNRATGVGVRNATAVTVEDVEVALAHTGIALLDSTDAHLSDSQVTNSTVGIDLLDSDESEVLANELRDNRHGIRLRTSDHNTLTDNEVRDHASHGLHFNDADNNSVVATDARNNDWSYYATPGAVNNTVTNLSLSTATVSFESLAVAVRGVSSPPAPPTGNTDIGQYVRVNATTMGNAWADLNVSYTGSDVTGVNESDLRMWRYNGSDWSQVATSNGVDTTRDIVFANATSFGVFAPLETTIAVPKIPGASGPAGNLDGDPLLEDVDGDGDGDVFDVFTYYDNRNSAPIQNNPQFFDYDGDGQAGTVFDAIKLYNKVS